MSAPMGLIQGLSQMSHLFNVAHTLRMMVQKERSLDILKVRRAVYLDSGSTWSLRVYIRLCCRQLSSLLERSLQSGPVPLAAFELWLTYTWG